MLYLVNRKEGNIMMDRKLLISKMEHLFRILFIMVWLSNLASTDAYISVYVLISFAAFYCTFQEVKLNFIISKREYFIFLLVSLFFSLITLAANYSVFTKVRDPEFIQSSTNLLVNVLNTFFSFIGGIVVAYPILKYSFCKIRDNKGFSGSSFDRKNYYFFCIVSFLFIFFVFIAHLFLVEYPGNVTEDPFTQISEMCTGVYSNFNTFWHTIFMQGIFSVGYFVFGNVNAAVALFCLVQAFIMAASFTYCLSTLYLVGVPKIFLFCSFVIYAFLPYNIALSITIWKDVLFAAGCLLMTCGIFRILYRLRDKQIWDYVITILGSFLFALSRNNGWYVFFISLLIILWPLRKQKWLVLSLVSVFAVCWLMTNPILSLLGVSGNDYTEALSIPLQQVSRVIADGHELTDDETQLISQVLDIDEVPDLYVNWLSDPIKVEFRSNNTDYFEENVGEYVRLWLTLGRKYPGSYFKAWVDQTKGYWNAGYGYGMYSETVTENPYGVAKAGRSNLIASLFRLYFGLSRHVIFFEPLHSIGLHVWITAICCLFCAMLKRKEWILSVPLLVIVLGLCFGTPVYASFRYAYPVFVCFPLILGTTLFHSKTKK